MTEQTLVKHVPLTAKTVQIGLVNALPAIQHSLHRQPRIHANVQLGTTQLHLTSVPNVQHIAQHAPTLLVCALNVLIHPLQSYLVSVRAPPHNISQPQTFAKHVLRTVLAAKI